MKKQNVFYKKSEFLFISILILLLNSCKTASPEKAELQNKINIAEEAVDQNDYKSAVKTYIEAIIDAENSVPEKVGSLKKALSRTYIEWSRQLYWEAKTEKSPELFKKAIYLCEKALEINPKYKIKCEVYISKFKKELASLKYKKATSINNLLPDSKERKYKIAVLFQQGEVLRQDKKYMKAKDKFEEILVLDPFHLGAARKIKRIMKTLTEIAQKRREVDETVKMAESEWKNVEPIAAREEAIEIARRETEAGTELKSRLEKCTIDFIEFKDTPLKNAFDYIENKINTALKEDFKFEFKDFSPEDKDFYPVTFRTENIPADAAIEALCDGFNLFPTYAKGSVIIQKRPE